MTNGLGKKNIMPLLFFHSLLLSAGLAANALSYDYSFTVECLANPHKPLYRGGIVVNPELDKGLKGWTAFGDAKIEQRESKKGNKFIVAHSRLQPHHSFSQTLHLEKGKLYTFSAWLQVSRGNANIAAVFKTPSTFEHAGFVAAKSGCWSMLKGGLTVNASGPAQLYFETNNTSVEIWADNISLQPFSGDEWRSHQNQSIEKARKSSVKLIAMDAKGNPLPNATLSIKQVRRSFPFGVAINNNILTNQAYQKWFLSKPFTVTTFENEMKWYSTESTRGREDYSVPDAMINLVKQHFIAVRGHNVVWNDPQFQPQWLPSLSPNDIKAATNKRINSIVRRYAGQLISWDVSNENLHFNFIERVFGNNGAAILFNEVRGVDSRPTLFLNEYNTIEESGDSVASPDKYLEKIRQIRAGGYNGPLGIGLESHFRTVNVPYVRASLDKLAAAKLPIWLSEVDVSSGPTQASELEKILREGHAHPSVSGIVIWSAWKPEGCYRMCLTDNNFKNLPTGDVVDMLLREWYQLRLTGTTDSKGHFEAQLFHGDYEVTVTHPNMKNSSSSAVVHNFKLVASPIMNDESQQKTVLHVKVST